MAKNKVTLQALSDMMASNSGCSKTTSETFVRNFFNVLKEALQKDNIIKIKGFGTFKLVVVAARESVNVNTGERVSISEYNKITFTPDKTLKNRVNKPFAQFDTIAIDEEDIEIIESGAEQTPDVDEQPTEIPANVHVVAAETIVATEPVVEQQTVEEPQEPITPIEAPIVEPAINEIVEVPQPEVEDKKPSPVIAAVLSQVPEENPVVETTIVEEPTTEEPAIEKVQELNVEPEEAIEEVLDPTEPEAQPATEFKAEEPIDEQVVAEPVVEPSVEEPSTEESVAEAPAESTTAPVVEDSPAEKLETPVEETTAKPKSRKGCITAAIIVGVLLIVALVAGAYYLGSNKTGADANSKTADTTTVSSVEKDTIMPTAEEVAIADSLALLRAKAANYDQVEDGEYLIVGTKTYRKMKPGYTLARWTLNVYGDKKYLPYVIKFNNLKNPDNIPLGTRLRFPELIEK